VPTPWHFASSVKLGMFHVEQVFAPAARETGVPAKSM